jgi:hypothetical protein
LLISHALRNICTFFISHINLTVFLKLLFKNRIDSVSNANMNTPAAAMENLSIKDDNRFDTLFSRIGSDCAFMILQHLPCSDLCRFASVPLYTDSDSDIDDLDVDDADDKSDNAGDDILWECIATRCAECDVGAPSWQRRSQRKRGMCNRQIDNTVDLAIAGVTLRAVSGALLMQKACKRCFGECYACGIVVCNDHSYVCKSCQQPTDRACANQCEVCEKTTCNYCVSEVCHGEYGCKGFICCIKCKYGNCYAPI